jgi:phosphatidylserine/phosphatidylglycerophosphate/cardiolipin synthase-like enzyme
MREAICMGCFGLLLGAASACAPEVDDEEVEEEVDWLADGKADTMAGPLVVTEIGDAFVEVRNDGSEAVDLTDWMVSFGRRRVRLSPHGDRSTWVAPGQVALILDADRDVPARVADVTPVADTAKDIEELLATSKRILLRTPAKQVADRADGRVPAVAGVSVERRLKTRWELCAVGNTPGVRNTLADEGALRVHFATPIRQDKNPLPEQLAALLAGAKSTIDAALYQIDHPAVVAALVDAAGRSVAVRIVTDSKYLDDPRYVTGYSALAAAGIPVVGDGRDGRAHNKFVVVDGRTVWTGSYNPVLDATGKFIVADNVVVFESPALAAIHTAELEEMFAGRFGPAKVDGGEHEVFIDGARVEVYFSPTDDPAAAILREIRRARSNIYFSQFAFYDRGIGAAMRERADAGVDVRGIFDKTSASAASEYGPMAAAGLDVRRPYYDAMLHHKLVIIDYGTTDPVVITGSFNLSNKAASVNDESVIVIHDPYVARAYYEVWRHLYNSGSGPNTDSADLAPVTFTEVLVDAGGAAVVELANTGDEEVDLGDLMLCDRDGRCVALVGELDGAGRLAIPTGVLDLDHADALVLTDDAGRVVATFDHPAFPGSGHSLERQDLATPDLDAVWQPSAVVGGSPGS